MSADGNAGKAAGILTWVHTHTLTKLQKLRKFRFQAENAAGFQVELNTIAGLDSKRELLQLPQLRGNFSNCHIVLAGKIQDSPWRRSRTRRTGDSRTFGHESAQSLCQMLPA